MLLCMSNCLQWTDIACEIKKKTINVITNESKENQLTIDTRVYLWTLNFIHLSICLAYASSTLSLLLYLHNKSSNIVLFQNCIRYFRLVVFPYEYKNQPCQFLPSKNMSTGIFMGLPDRTLEEHLSNIESLDPWAWYISPVFLCPP